MKQFSEWIVVHAIISTAAAVTVMFIGLPAYSTVIAPKNKMDTILNAHEIQSKREDYSSEKGLMKVFRYPSFLMANGDWKTSFNDMFIAQDTE